MRLQVEDFSRTPIIRKVLPHTGRLDGDDTGYRDIGTTVEICANDFDHPDILVSLSSFGIATHNLDAIGRMIGLTPYFGTGLGEIKPILLRLPAALALIQANQYLAHYDREVLVVSGMRTARMQQLEWRQSWGHVSRKNPDHDLPILEEISLGRKVDQLTAFCQIKIDGQYQEAFFKVQTRRAKEVAAASHALGIPESKVINELLTYQTNRGFLTINLDEDALTAHGGGGATDCWMLEKSTGRLVFLGVEYEHLGPAALIDYFEWATLEDYRHEVITHPALKQTMRELGIDETTQQVFDDCRRERRILCHAMRAVGCTYFAQTEGEPWHFNHGNYRGGRQRHLYNGAGNSCQSLLKNIRNPQTHRFVAVWSNRMGHELYRDFRRNYEAESSPTSQPN